MAAVAFVILLAPQHPLDALVESLAHRDVDVRAAQGVVPLRCPPVFMYDSLSKQT